MISNVNGEIILRENINLFETYSVDSAGRTKKKVPLGTQVNVLIIRLLHTIKIRFCIFWVLDTILKRIKKIL